MSTNLDQVIALDIRVPYGGQVEFQDTITPSARALNGHGDSVAADFSWVALDSFVVVLDSTTGATLGNRIGTGKIQALVGLLHSNPVSINVIPRIDSAAAILPNRDTVALDSISDTLRVQLFAEPIPASGRRVVFTATTFPAGGPVVTFVPKDTVVSNSSGVASVQIRLPTGAVADSVRVTTSATRPDGTLIPSASAFFVVEFRP